MKTAATALKLVVIAPDTQAPWVQEWVARFEGSTPIQWRTVLTSTASGDGWREDLPGLQASGAMLLVQMADLAWARQVLARLAEVGLPAGIVSRGVRPTGLKGLLSQGACDFLLWDCGRNEALLHLTRWFSGPVPTLRATPMQPARPAEAVQPHPALVGLIGQSPCFVEQVSKIGRLAGCDAGVLILGETGTGKDLFARAIHRLSARAGRPWVPVNCGALPGELVEAELFGHARGAFTSAHETREGLVAQAQGGTLFLDEVDSLSPAAQVKLLRFLQDKQYRPVGSSRFVQADVRILAACNSDLAGLCARGEFRSDLYYRLNVLALTLPALRERGADVLVLAEHFRATFAARHGREVRGLADDARTAMAHHAWPGNVRELEHAVERGVLMAEGALLRAADLGLPLSCTKGGLQGSESFQVAKARVVDQFERRYIERALVESGGNITHAARAVSKNRRAFWQLMRKHGIDSGEVCGLTHG